MLSIVESLMGIQSTLPYSIQTLQHIVLASFSFSPLSRKTQSALTGHMNTKKVESVL